jgi:hypothetical protein
MSKFSRSVGGVESQIGALRLQLTGAGQGALNKAHLKLRVKAASLTL